MNTKSINQQKLYKSCEQFVLSVYKMFKTQPTKLKAFINLFYRNKRMSSQLLESQMQLVELIQDFPDLVEQLNKLVPEDFRVPRLEQADEGFQEEQNEMSIEDAIRQLQSRHPDKVGVLINLIEEIKENKNPKNVDTLKEKMRLLLQEDEPNLYNLLTNKNYRALWDENISNKEEDVVNINESSNALSTKIEPEEKEDSKLKQIAVNKGLDSKKFKTNKRGPKPEVKTNFQIQNTMAKLDPSSLPPPIRSELVLFEFLQKNLNREKYDEFMKIIYLYTECVLSASEVFMLARPSFEEENHFSFFCDIISTREFTRRKNTTIFKPLNEIDFKKLECERNGSYTKVPDFFPYMKSPIHPKNSLAHVFLNKTWISVPQGSETNFKVKAKNSYEENLFKFEDERYEFDTVIYNCTMAIKWLNELENYDTEEKLNHMVDRILRLKVGFFLSYNLIEKEANCLIEIVEIFKKSPINVAKVLAERIQTKLKEIRDTKFNQARRKWHEMSQENFHRSLDHRSFYFKQYEKKFTHQKSFNAEAIARYNDVNTLGNVDNLKKYWSILNTFEGISNGVSCKYIDNDEDRILESVKRRSFPRKNLPIYRLVFSNKKINQDIFDMLCLKIQAFHANQTEKDKINRYLRLLMIELLQFPYELGRTYDLVLEPKTFFDIVSRIEAKIYDKSFNFNTAKRDETEKSAAETIYSAIDRLRSGNKSSSDRRKEVGENGLYKDTVGHIPISQGQGFSKRMDEEYANKKDPTESLDDELRLDSGSEDQPNVREMEYATTNHKGPTSDFLPQSSKNKIMFYGTQHVYHLIRFYFALYERFLKAYEISQEYEANSKTALLSEDEKKKLAHERYEIFKWILAHLIRGNIDNEKYEDLLRSIFGNKAYLMSYIDKIVHLIVITIQKLGNDDISLKSLNLYPERDLIGKVMDTNSKLNSNKPKDWVENVYLSQLNHLTLKNMSCLQGTTFYRFLFDPENHNLIINLYNSPYKDWNDKILDTIAGYSQGYLNYPSEGQCLKASVNNIYLKRAKERNRKKTVRVLVKIELKNNIEWKYSPNTIKAVTDSFHQEDFLYILKRKANPSQEVLKRTISKIKSINRFREWHANTLQSISTK